MRASYLIRLLKDSIVLDWAQQSSSSPARWVLLPRGTSVCLYLATVSSPYSVDREYIVEYPKQHKLRGGQVEEEFGSFCRAQVCRLFGSSRPRIDNSKGWCSCCSYFAVYFLCLSWLGVVDIHFAVLCSVVLSSQSLVLSFIHFLLYFIFYFIVFYDDENNLNFDRHYYSLLVSLNWMITSRVYL